MIGGPERSERRAQPEGREDLKPGRIDRILPNDFQTEVGSPADALNKAIPYFGEEIVKAQLAAIQSGSTFQTLLVFEDTENHTERKVQIESDGDPKSVRIVMSGAWKETEQTPPGLPLKISEKEKGLQLYRRLSPKAEPLVEIGQLLEPGAGIVVAMKGKRNRRVLRLPKMEFPQGGKVTAVDVPDNKDGMHVQGGYVYAYVEPIK